MNTNLIKDLAAASTVMIMTICIGSIAVALAIKFIKAFIL